MQGFQLPSALHKFIGQVIQKFGMGGQFSLTAKITRRIDDAPAHVMHPKPVHQDAGGERMVSTGEPLGIG